MGFQYRITIRRVHNDVLPHIVIEMIAGKGPTASRKLAVELGSFNSENLEEHRRLEEIRRIITGLNKELATFKTSYEGPRLVTGKKIYTSIIICAILHRFIDDFPALDIDISEEAKYLYAIYVTEEVLGINAGIEETEEQIFSRFHFNVRDRESCVRELAAYRRVIFMAMDHYSMIYTGKNIIETIYGRRLEDDATTDARMMLYDKGEIRGYDWTTGSYMISHEPEYLIVDDVNSLISASVKLIYSVIAQKTGLSMLKVMETLRNEGRRIVYDQRVSISLEKPSRALSAILKAYNTIPDRYERLEDSLKTLDILLSNI